MESLARRLCKRSERLAKATECSIVFDEAEEYVMSMMSIKWTV